MVLIYSFKALHRTMNTNWGLLLGFFCPTDDIELLTSAVMTRVGHKTSTGESTVWGIQAQRNDYFWIRFREAKARDMLLACGGFTCHDHFISVFPLGDTVQWFRLSGIPMIVEKSSIVSALQHYGSIYESVYETVQGFDDVYTGDLRVLLDVSEQLPEVLMVCGYHSRIVCLGPVNQISGSTGLNTSHHCPKNSCRGGMLQGSELDEKPKDSSANKKLPGKKCDDNDENLVTDAIPFTLPHPKKESPTSAEQLDELWKLRYNNMGAAIAWGYFIYLRDTALKKLKKRREVYEDCQLVSIHIQKLIILVPMSCSYKSSETMIIEHAQNLEEYKDDVAGTVGRSYHLSVYKMREGREKIYFIPETASCLNALDTMRNEFSRTGLTESLQGLIRDQFVAVLEYLLYLDRECREKYELLYTEGTDAVLAQEIRLLKEKKDVRKNAKHPDISKYHWDYDNFGVGLANWFYFNYLKLILGGYPHRMKTWESKEEVTLYPKLIILVPKSCLTKPALNDDDEDIKEASPLEDHVENSGTTVGRKYSQSIYKVDIDQENAVQHCAPQYATPIRQLYEMTKCPNHYLEKEVMAKARDDFTCELKELLSVDKSELDICEVIYFDDDEQSVVTVLRELLIAESNKQTLNKAAK